MPSLASKNGIAVFHTKGKIYLLQSLSKSSFEYFLAESRDGEHFVYSPTPVVLYSKKQKTAFGKSFGFRESIVGSETLLSWVEPGKGLMIAELKKPHIWRWRGNIENIHQSALLVPTEKKGKNERHLVFYVSGQATLSVGWITAKRLHFEVIGPVARLSRESEYLPFTLLSAEKTDEGILILYSAANGWGFPTIGVLLVDEEKPEHILWRSETPLWERPLSVPPVPPVIIGCQEFGGKRLLYLERFDGGIESIVLPEIRTKAFPKLERRQRTRKKERAPASPELVRFSGNPLLEPLAENHWEAFAVFNPAALQVDGTVHLLYRAQGHDGISVLGYASSRDGIHVDERSSQPVFVSSRDFDTRGSLADHFPYPYVSGGGYGGCEDPRLILIEERVYLIYVAFDGVRPPGVALTSISKEDFLAKRWTWKSPKLISRPGKIQKNWVLFPEKIHSKFAIIHGVSPSIQIEYLDSLDDLGDGKYIDSLESHGGGGYVQPERRGYWDNIIRGAGAPPLKTKAGWLVFYHAMDFRDPGKYKVGVLLLDLQHPETIVARAKKPILEPITVYENNGHKRGVIYVCGAVEKDGVLFVYYGASDRSAAVAAAPLDTFLDDLLSNRQPILNSVEKRGLSS